MKIYIHVANASLSEACRPELTPEQQYKFLKRAGECVNKAAKAGGFRNASDMYKWLTLYNQH